MIMNERQFQITKRELGRFEEATKALRKEPPPATRRRIHALEIAALESQAADLRAEIDEYEALRSGEIDSFQAASLPELATALIKARIARGWTQRDLADRLGVAEQQIQRYEAAGYASASLARLNDIAAALQIDIQETVSLRTPGAA